jgi:uncharacterized membrane protein
MLCGASKLANVSLVRPSQNMEVFWDEIFNVLALCNVLVGLRCTIYQQCKHFKLFGK